MKTIFNSLDAPRKIRRSRGFSLLELLIVVAALSSVAAMAVMGLSGTQSAAKATKLRQDVAALNSAVRIYLISGGDLSTTSDANAVLAKLKTTTNPSSRAAIAGLRGSMVDLRLRGVMSSVGGESKAVWDNARKAFVVRTNGSGYSEFVLDPAAVPASLTEESRTSSLAMNSVDKWVWAFSEQPPAKSRPRAGTTGTDSLVVTPNSATTMTVLQAPAFSKPGTLYDYSAFNPDLKVSVLDRNIPNSAETYYSISNGPWVRWAGTPISIPRALTTELRAYSAPLDPDRFEQSATASAVYETIFFAGGSSGLFKNPAGDSGLVTNLRDGLANQLFTWGTPANDKGANYLNFTGKTFMDIAPDELFELGTLTYFNGSTYAGTNASSVQLSITLNLSTPNVVETLPFTFSLLSTPNKGMNDDNDADYVYIPDVSTQFNTSIKGQTFYLVLSFGSKSSNGFTTIDEFHTHENKAMTGSIFGRFTTNPTSTGVASTSSK